MREFELTLDQLKELRFAHGRAKYAKDVRLAYRLNALILLGGGWTLKAVSEALLLDEESLRAYVGRFRESGIAGLSKDKHSGSQCHLSANQLKQLKGFMDEAIRLSTKEPVEFVRCVFDVEYSARGMGKLLKRLGYSYKKPKLVPGKANVEAQLAFLEDYHFITENLGAHDAVYFSDATHPTHNTMAAYGWIKKGMLYEVKANSGRQRLNICGAMNICSGDFQYQFEETVNAVSMLRLFKGLEEANPFASNIYVILDNARYNHSRILRQYLQNSRVKPLYLPPYSPNLNLIERLWKFMNKRVLYNRYYEKFDHMKAAVAQFCENISLFKTELASLLTENFQIIGIQHNT